MQVSHPHHSPPHPSLNLVYPPSSLHQTTIDNAKRIHQLEHLIRTERQELNRLLAHSPTHKRSRHSSPASSTPTTPSPPRPSPNSLSSSMHTSSTSPPTVPTTPPALPHPTPHTSPKGIMDTYQTPPHVPPRKPPLREMAARGSHWSFVEKARFEAALHKYGPFAWDHIIRTVGTRSEKQVKAYAARYRRRKKLAAKAQLEAAELLPIQKPAHLAPSVPSLHPVHHPVRPPPTPPPAPVDHPQPPPCQNPPLLEPLHIDGLLPPENHHVDHSALCDDLFAPGSLFDTPLVDNTEELPDVNHHQPQPNQVELLVDQALRADYVLDEKPSAEREPDPLPDGFPTDFLNSVFTH